MYNYYLEPVPLNVIYNYIFLYQELSKYLERKEELELIKIKQQQKNCVQSFGASKLNACSTERKTKLELPENGN